MRLKRVHFLIFAINLMFLGLFLVFQFPENVLYKYKIFRLTIGLSSVYTSVVMLAGIPYALWKSKKWTNFLLLPLSTMGLWFVMLAFLAIWKMDLHYIIGFLKDGLLLEAVCFIAILITWLVRGLRYRFFPV